MLRIIEDDNGAHPLSESEIGLIAHLANVHEDRVKDFLISELVTTFSEDKEFLRKINKVTFGLISGQ